MFKFYVLYFMFYILYFIFYILYFIFYILYFIFYISYLTIHCSCHLIIFDATIEAGLEGCRTRMYRTRDWTSSHVWRRRPRARRGMPFSSSPLYIILLFSFILSTYPIFPLLNPSSRRWTSLSHEALEID